MLHEPLAVVVLAKLPQELEQLGGELRVSHDGARPWRGLGARAYLQSRMQRTARVSGRSSGMNPSRFGIDTFGSECRSEEHTSELQSRPHLVCRLLLEKKKNVHDPHAVSLEHSWKRLS